MLSGVATSFFGKGNLVMMEAEGHSRVPRTTVSKSYAPKTVLKDLHSVASFCLQEKTVNSVKDTFEGGIGGPVAVEDAVADTAMAVDVGMEEWSHKAALGREGREIFRHLKVQQESAAFVWSIGRLIGHVSTSSRIHITVHQNLRPP